MDNNIDPVTGEIVETPSASPAETTTPESTEDNNPQGVSNANPEEVAWSQLKGGTQDRIKSILSERDSVRAEVDYWKQQALKSTQQSSVQNPTSDSPEIQNAVAQLSKVGMATKDEVDQLVNQRLGSLVYNFELKDLERKLDGTNGMPKFDRSEYEDFVRRNPQYQTYNPEHVYEKMYSEEILDAKLKERGVSSSTTSLKPTKTAIRDEQWSPEWIENRMKQPDGLQWYASNKQKVNNYLASTVTD